MSQTRTYPHGVPSWVDTEQPDPEAAKHFYTELFGWTFSDVSPPGAPFYSVASLAGRDAAGLSTGDAAGLSTGGAAATWSTYIAVDSADATATAAQANGGELLMAPADTGPAGRMAIVRDPAGAVFRIWEARARRGAQIVNEPGSWNFSDLHTDQRASLGFYRELFGWDIDELGFATLIRRPGYGDHLQATVDPGIRERQKGVAAPPGFADAIGWVATPTAGSAPSWHVTFAVRERDEAVRTAERLGAAVSDVQDTRWNRSALVRDPQGAVFTVSQFTAPDVPATQTR